MNRNNISDQSIQGWLCYQGDTRTLIQRSAAEQGGILSGDNPLIYSPADPFRLWAIQTLLIIGISRICVLMLYKLKQPRAVAEIFGGIVLGPTLLGRIPHFSNTIFPAESIPLLQLCATIGLVFFLFLGALEIDHHAMGTHRKESIAISLAGLLVPAGFGCLLALILYPKFADPSLNFGIFLFFTIVSVSITAFPILCKMLVDLSLFRSKLGVVVISAGVGNDIVGWVLLALAVSLTNSASGLTALWILLTCIGYTLFCWYPVRLGYRWLAVKSGSLQSGNPSPLMVSLAIVIVIVNAFFTDIIGLHAIFGGFLAGLVIPQDNGFSVAMMGKFEGIIYTVFLPIFFALSGFKTDFGLLNTGEIWAYTIVICILAFAGKFIGCGLTAKYFGFTVKESCAIGTLMTCKGLLELIVLNLALQAKVFDQRLFAMYMVHAMILTFGITPLVALCRYSLRLRWHSTGSSSDVSD
ncbi:Sodium/hydrogen exchanger [Marasmius fiardii PR-910]|nr:Sodium/hydrogen exchanger [Marasmius fiardii PR-910]